MAEMDKLRRSRATKRRYKEKNEKRSTVLSMRITADEATLIRTRAQELSLSQAEFIVRAVNAFDIGPGNAKIPNISTHDGAFLLGLLWGCVARDKNVYYLRSKSAAALDRIKRELALQGEITVHERGEDTFQFMRKADLDMLIEWLQSLGWVELMAQRRTYPESDELDHRGFVGGWCALRGEFKAQLGHGKTVERVRIHGNVVFLQKMSQIIAHYTGLGENKPHRASGHPNDTTKFLIYKGSSARLLCRWLGMREIMAILSTKKPRVTTARGLDQ